MEKKLFYLFFRYSCSACLLLYVGQKKSSHLISFKKKRKSVRSVCSLSSSALLMNMQRFNLIQCGSVLMVRCA